MITSQAHCPYFIKLHVTVRPGRAMPANSHLIPDGSRASSTGAVSLLIRNGLRIRYFRRTDSAKVRELFLFAMSNGPGSPRRLTLDAMFLTPAAHIAYALTITGLSITIASHLAIYMALGGVLSVAVTGSLFGYRYLLSRSFTDFYDKCLTEDLADIASYYHMQPARDGTEDFGPSGPSGFWVVEQDLPNAAGTDIIGCVALDCSYENGVIRGELRRMNVSPHYRRQGIAGLLVRTLIAHARKHGVPAVVLTTTHFQETAITMYKKLGWLETGRDVIHEAYGVIQVVLIHYGLELNSPPRT
ncbi:acyl-CoA N-acyltransferase [Lyophyllum atratum]|nr:acyl-CoA N-acyltransferase [Lyophyllum atratum]